MNPLRSLPGLVGVLVLGTNLALAANASADPATDYMLHCRGCHGPEGAGTPPDVPDFRGEIGRFLAVDGGREYLIRIPGVSQSELSDARTAALLSWLVRHFDAERVPPDFREFTAAEVTRHRRPPLTDVATVRAALLGGSAAASRYGWTDEDDASDGD